MREILFRGKRIDNGKWIEGCYTFSKKASRHIIWVQSESNAEFWHTYPIAVDPLSVGQFTGLTDKNGKKIFEGDIVSLPLCDGIVGVAGMNTIFFEEQVRKSEGVEIKTYAHHKSNTKDNGEFFEPKCFEVIGNIHDKQNGGD